MTGSFFYVRKNFLKSGLEIRQRNLIQLFKKYGSLTLRQTDMGKKIDYKKIEKEFMTTTTTLSKLSKKYKCAVSPLYRYAKEHEWEKKKEEKDKERVKKAIEKADVAQDESWQALQVLIRDVINKEWEKLKKEKDPHPTATAALTRATQDARAMGVYGITTNEKKLLKEIENLDRQLKETETDKSVTFVIKGAEEYGN